MPSKSLAPSLTLVAIDCVLPDLVVEALEQRDAGVEVAVHGVILHRPEVGAAVEHDAVADPLAGGVDLSVVVDVVVLDAHVVTPLRGD